MSWHPSDLVTDTDLLAYESGILTNFNVGTWQTKRAKALEDWLGPILRTQGYQIERLRTRYEADLVLGHTAAVYTDLTDKTRDNTADDLDLAAVFATVGTDALYFGSKQTFRGLSIRMADSVSAVTAKTTVSIWADNWKAQTLTDGTIVEAGKAYSGGGAITWAVPSTWVKRSINGSDPLYWAKVTISATPTAATAGQIGVIRRSVLCAPAALRTLTLIMREAPTGGSGPWIDKAAYYETEADAALQRALLICGGEFETDEPPTDLISEEESEQTTAEAAGTGWRMERY
jgi:hypothetical protein